MDSNEHLVLTEEQHLLQKSARELFDATAPISELRRLRDSQDAHGYVPELWTKMAELGWSAMLIPEKYQGIDFGFAGLSVIMSESGRSLSASPLLMTAAVGVSALMRAAPEAIKKEVLPKIASGEHTLTLAIEEGTTHEPFAANALSATQKAQTFTLNGTKRFVLDGGFADYIIVSASLQDGGSSKKRFALFLVDGKAKGLQRTPLVAIDHRNCADLSFKNVSASLLAQAGTAEASLDFALDVGRLAIAAEMYGAASECFDRTVKYLKEREQFGVKIGTFQALQHRAAQLYTLLELTHSVILDANAQVERAWNGDNQEARKKMALAVAHAKTYANDCFHKVSSEGIQMHGGIGMTDEFDIGFFLKRMQTAAQSFGDSHFLRARYADLAGI